MALVQETVHILEAVFRRVSKGVGALSDVKETRHKAWVLQNHYREGFKLSTEAIKVKRLDVHERLRSIILVFDTVLRSAAQLWHPIITVLSVEPVRGTPPVKRNLRVGVYCTPWSNCSQCVSFRFVPWSNVIHG